MATSRRRRSFAVYNGTGAPVVFNAEGAYVFPGESREADPNDPVTKMQLAARKLIVKEG